MVLAAPTLLNISPSTLETKAASLKHSLDVWQLSLQDLTPSVLGCALTASLPRLLRLQYVAFLGHCAKAAVDGKVERPARRIGMSYARTWKPSSVIMMREADFQQLYPRYERWRRRKLRGLHVAPTLMSSDPAEGDPEGSQFSLSTGTRP
jgi:hypothetical protein